jgi:hypothetical protein
VLIPIIVKEEIVMKFKLALGACLLVLPAVAFITLAPADPPTPDTVSGSGVAITGEEFTIDATTKGAGKAAGGTLTFTVTDPAALGSVTVRVTCLTANGNEAVVGGRVTETTSAAFSHNEGVVVYVRDDNNPDDLRIEPASVPVKCIAEPSTSPIQSGDITVVDN